MSLKAKQDPIFQSMVSYLGERMEELPDRRVGDNRFIKMRDIALGAFSTFFMQCPSFLQQQKLLEKRAGKSNVKALFGVEHIPSDNHIRSILDEVPPPEVFSVYDFALNRLNDSGLLKNFRFLDDQLLLAIDGVQYYSSGAISCEQCNHAHHKNGSVTYSHSMVAAALVHPDCKQVVPLKPEFIVPQDGHVKQDCERAAMKRWLSLHGKQYGKLGSTLLGDDLYACQPVCEQALAQSCHFIFTCKRDSHKTLYEWVDPFLEAGQLKLHEKSMKVKGKRYTYRCRYLNDVPIRDGEDALKVNWCTVEVFNATGKKVYSGAFITDHIMTDKKVFDIIKAARTRWKIENEHNNTLKNQGYHLAHNYGHGHKHLSSFLATLILLSFLFHNMLALLDARYQALRKAYPRYMFFNEMKTLLRLLLFSSWDSLMEFVIQKSEIELIDTG